jgi:hypothetical protein
MPENSEPHRRQMESRTIGGMLAGLALVEVSSGLLSSPEVLNARLVYSLGQLLTPWKSFTNDGLSFTGLLL